MDKFTSDATIIKQIVECYCKEHDITFLLEEEYHYGRLAKSTCVGWYCGEPNLEDSIKFTGKLEAVYSNDWL